MKTQTALTLPLLLALCIPVLAQTTQPAASLTQSILDRASSSLVVVKFTWDAEFGKRELAGGGVVVGEGLVMVPMGMFDPRFPDAQITDVKIIVPEVNSDHEEVSAKFVGRDERTNVAFVRRSSLIDRDFKPPLTFNDFTPVVGQTVYSVGLLPKAAGYKSYIYTTTVAANLRGESPSVLVSGALTSVGSVVFDDQGRAIGLVQAQGAVPIFLYDSRADARQDRPVDPMAVVNNPPRFFTPTRDFLLSLQDPPKDDAPLKLAWMGVPSLRGLTKDESEFFGLVDQPAVEIGDTIPNGPADRAGLKPKQIILKIDGKPLERGDEPDELPGILRRQLLRKKVGDSVTFTVLPGRKQAQTDVTVTLEELPARANTAARFYAEDLGYSVRELVFIDTYSRRLPSDQKGVLVSFVKQQSSAGSAKLLGNDLVTEMNGQPVTNLEQFKSDYAKFRKEKPTEAVVLVVIREANTQTIRIEPPR